MKMHFISHYSTFSSMDRFSFSSTASERRRRRRSRIWGIMGAALVILVLLTAVLAIWLPAHHRDSPSQPQQPFCPKVVDTEKFDCHPDRPISSESCEKRGCCYQPTTDLKDRDLIASRSLGVPSCYFPQDYKGYELKNVKRQDSAVRAELERITPSGFPDDVQTAILTVKPIDDYRLRIQIKNSLESRFEPEIPIFDDTQEHRNEAYKVYLSSDGILEVTRKHSNISVFRTDLSRLIFSNQFLQLSTLLTSKYVYGLGEQKETILKSTSWTRYTLFNQGDLPVPNRNLYGSHPFYLVMEPGGESNGVFLLNSNAMDYILQPTPALTFRPVGGIFDFFIFLGPTPGAVVSQYSSLFGPPNFPPRWSLGFHLCRYGYFSLNRTVEVLNRNLEEGIPVDVQWHDIDYMKRFLDFTYDAENFEELPEFVKKLHNDGRHYVAMISPGVSNTEKPGSYPAYDEGKRLDLFVKGQERKYIEAKVWNDNTTVFPDFSNPVTQKYWNKQFKTFHSTLNFDGVWLDMNEPYNFLNGSTEGCPPSALDNPIYVPGRPYPLNIHTLCMSARHHKTYHYNEHNLVAYREAKATYSAMKEITGKRPFLISRASFSGQGIYSGHWSGDITSNWNDMGYTIPAMLAFSLYGIPMTGSDICGFRLNTTEELCARWQVLGAFYPFSRNHNDYDTFDQDPAAMGPRVIEVTKKALNIRYYLLPYLYTLFYRNHVYGETVARPIFFEYPKEKITYNMEDKFLWGPAFLIVPVLKEGTTTLKTYIPPGIWYNLSGKSYRGNRMIELTAGISDVNVLVRGGYILPAQTPGNTTTDSALNPFDLLVALDDEGKASGELFWDDGETLDTYKNHNYNLIKMSAAKNILNVFPKIKGYTADMKLKNLEVYGAAEHPNNVTINDENVNYNFHDGDNLLRINATGFTLLQDLVVRWI